MAYAAASDVAGLCRNLLSSSANFSTSTSPTLADVNNWLSSGCAVIESHLSSAGYTTPVAPTSPIYSWLTELNALYGASRAELSRALVSTQMGERTRGQILDRLFWDGLTKLLGINLSSPGAGLSTTSEMSLYVGGISQSDKEAVASSTDRVKPRFRRGQFIAPDYDADPTSDSED